MALSKLNTDSEISNIGQDNNNGTASINQAQMLELLNGLLKRLDVANDTFHSVEQTLESQHDKFIRIINEDGHFKQQFDDNMAKFSKEIQTFLEAQKNEQRGLINWNKIKDLCQDDEVRQALFIVAIIILILIGCPLIWNYGPFVWSQIVSFVSTYEQVILKIPDMAHKLYKIINSPHFKTIMTSLQACTNGINNINLAMLGDVAVQVAISLIPYFFRSIKSMESVRRRLNELFN